jgi:phage-related protein
MKLEKKKRPLALGSKISSAIYHLRLCLKILLVGVIIGVLIFLIEKAVPVAQWIIGFLTSIYDFFVEAIEWVVDLLVSIYDWIVEAIEGIISNIKKVVGFVDDFPNIIGGFFDDMWDDLMWVIEKLT